MQPVTPSSTDVTVHIRIIDSAAGTPETGVTSASAGLALSYRKGATAALTAITESDLAALTTAHTDGGMKHVDAGLYRVDLPDAAVPTAEGEVTWVGGVVTDMIVIPTAIVGRVVPLAPTTAGRTLDVTAGGEAGIDWANIGSPTTAVNLSATNIDVDQVVASVSGAVGSVTGNVGGNVAGSVGSVTGAVGSVTGAVGSVAAGGITAASIATDAIDADAIADNAITTAVFAAGTTIPRVTLADTVTTYTGNTPQTGDSFARLGAPAGASVSADIAAAKANLVTLLAGVTVSSIATNAISAASIASAGAAKIADIVLRRTTANVEASSDGDTLGGRSLYGAVARLAHKVSISGSTMTITKADDSTSLTTATVTTSSSADPLTAVDPAA